MDELFKLTSKILFYDYGIVEKEHYTFIESDDYLQYPFPSTHQLLSQVAYELLCNIILFSLNPSPNTEMIQPSNP